MKMKRLTLLLLTFILVFSGCQVAKELHYFRQGDNYYRLNVKAKAIASKSRYIAGYFDEHAVDNYFSELTKPDSVSFIARKSNQTTSKDIESLEDVSNAKLVMILSTNSDVVSEQIGNLAQNEQTLEMLARLSNKDKIEENIRLQEELDKVYTQNQGVIQAGDIFISSLDTIPDKAEEQLLTFLNFMAAIKGYNVTFRTTEEAVDWLNNK